MNWWEFAGIATILYHSVYLILPFFIDCDIQLFFKKIFGRSINSLSGKVVWIVGASSGIGEYLAYELAKVNCKIILSARRVSELEKVKINCHKINPQLLEKNVKILEMDVCNVETHEKALTTIIETYGTVDILVNNAGRSQRAQWELIDHEVDKELFQLNVFSQINLTRIVYRHWTENQEKGHIAVTSSLAGILGVPFSASYTGSKHALHGYFESLRTEKMNTDIPITMVCPGAIATPFLSQSFTAKTGEKFNQETEMLAKNKISSERCAHLMATAIANNLNECWIAHSRSLQLTYLMKYYPNLSTIILKYLGQSFIQRLRDNKVTMKTT